MDGAKICDRGRFLLVKDMNISVSSPNGQKFEVRLPSCAVHEKTRPKKTSNSTDTLSGLDNIHSH